MHFSIYKQLRLFSLFIFFLTPSVQAENTVQITEKLPSVDIKFNSKIITIQRNQDQNNKLVNSFAKTSRPCPPFCIQPITIAPEVKTIGELELLHFMQNDIKNGTGLLIDARMPEWYEKSTIPGSINIPFTVLTAQLDSPYTVKILTLLGAKKIAHTETKKSPLTLNFDQTKSLALYCNGIWCSQATNAIKSLLSVGYPPEKLLWYRGGMQAWLSLGFNTYTP